MSKYANRKDYRYEEGNRKNGYDGANKSTNYSSERKIQCSTTVLSKLVPLNSIDQKLF